MGTAMMGPDYTQWHGFYEVAKAFYTEFIPEAERLEPGVTESVMKTDYHKWHQGLTPEEIEAADRILALMQEQGYTSPQEIAEAFARGRVSLPAALADAMGLNPRTA